MLRLSAGTIRSKIKKKPISAIKPSVSTSAEANLNFFGTFFSIFDKIASLLFVPPSLRIIFERLPRVFVFIKRKHQSVSLGKQISDMCRRSCAEGTVLPTKPRFFSPALFAYRWKPIWMDSLMQLRCQVFFRGSEVKTGGNSRKLQEKEVESMSRGNHLTNCFK